jgi:hypothetical protein
MSAEPPDHPWRTRPSPEVRRAALSSPEPQVPVARPRRVTAGRPPVSKFRSAAFATALVVLVGAVPTLGWVGLTLIRDSKAGTLITRVSDPRAPGYEALVDSTPTALIIQKDSRGGLVSLAFLALGSSDGGGSLMFLPINTAVEKPAYGVDRYVTAYRSQGERSLVGQVGNTLRVGLDEVVDVNDAKWAALTAKSAPVRFDNPDTVSAGAFRFPAGRVALLPRQVGPYLSAINAGESDLNRLNRQQLFWQAWLKAIGPSPREDVIPGETKSGIGFFVRTLAAGPVRAEPLPVNPNGVPLFTGGQLFRPLKGQIRKDIAEMVPYPTAPKPGTRVAVRLLNGADPDPIPRSIVQRLVSGGATIDVVGNDSRFDRAKTVIQYRDPSARSRAMRMRIALGGRGRLVLNVRGSDAVDVTIVLGRDLLRPGRTSSGSVRPPTVKANSNTTTTRSRGAGG